MSEAEGMSETACDGKERLKRAEPDDEVRQKRESSEGKHAQTGPSDWRRYVWNMMTGAPYHVGE